MLLRVRGNGASAENSQAALVHLRGFRLTNTRPPSMECRVGGKLRPMLFTHFHVGVQVPDTDSDAKLNAQLCGAVWKEIWNMYDIVYDELCIFPPEPDVVSAVRSSAPSTDELPVEEEHSTGFTPLTSRTSSHTPVVVTHYFPREMAQFRLTGDTSYGKVVVLDVSHVPLTEAATKVTAETAWLAAYASLRGALDAVKHVVVRLPYECIGSSGQRSPAVEEGLDLLGEHLTLLALDFVQVGDASDVDVHFIGSAVEELKSLLGHLSGAGLVSGGSGPRELALPVIFVGDHHRNVGNTEELQTILSSLGIEIVFELVPLKKFIDGGDVVWDEATSRENQVLNFCPCCGHCGGH